MPVFTTACPRNCYSTCTARVHVEDGRIVRLEPHTGNHATPEGVCLKGLSYVERTHSPDRLLHPLRRRPGTSEHTRISWDGALDTIAGKLERARDALGPQSIFFYAASGTKGLLNQVSHDFWRLFGGYTTTYGDLCWPAGLEATRLTLGENKHSDPADVARAKLIVMWGKNPAETNIHQTIFINDALEAGGRLVVIDPRRTETAERAHLLIQPRPGTDGALALGLAHLLVRRGQIDDAFIANHVLGFDAYREMIEAYPPERVAAITGVSRVDVERLAELIGAQSPVTINAGFGMQRYVNSGQTMRAIIALLAITGNIGKPGAGWVFANLTSHIFGEVKDPVGFYPPSEPDGVVRVSVSTALLGRQMLEMKGLLQRPLRFHFFDIHARLMKSGAVAHVGLESAPALEIYCQELLASHDQCQAIVDRVLVVYVETTINVREQALEHFGRGLAIDSSLTDPRYRGFDARERIEPVRRDEKKARQVSRAAEGKGQKRTNGQLGRVAAMASILGSSKSPRRFLHW